MTGPGKRPTPSVANELADLARQVASLSPDRRDPEQFHMAKSEIAAGIRRCARQIDAAERPRIGRLTVAELAAARRDIARRAAP
jgi:hypothetical protein